MICGHMSDNMKRDILITCTMREKSDRLKNKLTRKFANTTLADVAMRKLEKLQQITPTIVAIYPGDKEIYEKAQSYNLSIKDRTKKSITTATKCNEICSFLKDFEFSHIIWLNATAPFIRLKTVLDLKGMFEDDETIESMHFIKENKNWFWDSNHNSINMELDVTRTQDAGTIYESIHTMHLYNRKYMLETGAYWSGNNDDPRFLLVEDNIEWLDIDTITDFKICEAIYNVNK